MLANVEMTAPSAISVTLLMSLSNGSLSGPPVAARTTSPRSMATLAMRKKTNLSVANSARTVTNLGPLTTPMDGIHQTWHVDVFLKIVKKSLMVTTDALIRTTVPVATAVRHANGLGTLAIHFVVSPTAPCAGALTANETI